MINEFDKMELVLLNVLLQATVLSGLALGLAVFLRNRAAKLYGLLYPALVSLLLLVFVSVIIQFAGKGLVFLHLGSSEHPVSQPHYSLVPDQETGGGVNSGSFATSTVPTPSEARGNRFNFATLLSQLWLIGSIAFLVRLGFGLKRIRQLALCARPLTRQQSNKVACLIDEPTLSRLRILQHTDVNSPVLIGVRSPVLLLPAGLIENLNNKELKSVLIHELAHFRRRDFARNLVQKLAVAIFWFHPLVHLMDRIVSRAREEICDNHVLHEVHAVDYGQTLLRVNAFIQSRQSKPVQAATEAPIVMGVFGGNWKLEQRISELLSNSREATMQLKPLFERTIQAAVITVTLFLGASHVGAAQTDTDTTQDAIDNAQREQAERQARELDAQVQQLDRAEASLDRERQEMQSRVTAVREELALRAEEQTRLLESQSQELEAENRQLNKMQEELQRQIQSMQSQHREIEQQLRIERRRLRQELNEVRETLKQELSQQNISADIGNAIRDLQQSLSELDEQDLSNGNSLPGLDVNELTRTALVSALESLEELDVEALERQIIEQVELSLLDFKLEDMDIDQDQESDVELTLPSAVNEPAEPL